MHNNIVNPQKKLNIPSSFRDPSGFLFIAAGVLYRQINHAYKEHYEHLLSSGLYDALITDSLLIPHEEVALEVPADAAAYKIIKPGIIPFISYPYEWCFSQLKQAALTTLSAQKIALSFGMTLKDASAYNIQFLNTKPILIDTLSFEKYIEGRPWVAYRQFCQHFLSPLILMSCKDMRMGQLSRVYLDGIPLDLTSRLLPLSTYLNLGVFLHIHFHAKMQKKCKTPTSRQERDAKGLSRFGFSALIDNLESLINNLRCQSRLKGWLDYYEKTNYSVEAFEAKKNIIRQYLDLVKPQTVFDFGANTGLFSRIASNMGIFTVSFDSEPSVVEENYLTCIRRSEKDILPLVFDIENPTPAIGWNNQERMTLWERGPADVAIALALMHHLVITDNIALRLLAHFFSKVCRWLIIEFVPPSDSWAQQLIRRKGQVFSEYTEELFEQEFSKYFVFCKKTPISDSLRSIYLFKNKNGQ